LIQNFEIIQKCQ